MLSVLTDQSLQLLLRKLIGSMFALTDRFVLSCFFHFSFECYVQNAPHSQHCVVIVVGLFERAVWLQRCSTPFIAKASWHVESALIDEDHSGLIEPLDAFAIFPEAVLYAGFCLVYIYPKAMLLALVPPSFVSSSISPNINTVAFFFIIQIISVISDTIVVYVNSMTLHVVSRPLSIVFAAISPEVCTKTIDLIV